jgi:hypothetical protein
MPNLVVIIGLGALPHGEDVIIAAALMKVCFTFAPSAPWVGTGLWTPPSPGFWDESKVRPMTTIRGVARAGPGLRQTQSGRCSKLGSQSMGALSRAVIDASSPLRGRVVDVLRNRVPSQRVGDRLHRGPPYLASRGPLAFIAAFGIPMSLPRHAPLPLAPLDRILAKRRTEHQLMLSHAMVSQSDRAMGGAASMGQFVAALMCYCP